MDKDVKELFESMGARCSELEFRMSAVENIKDPDVLHGRINNIVSVIENMSDKIQLVFEKVSAMDLDKRFIERFTNEDLKSYYMQSGVTLQQIKKYFDECVSKEPVDVTLISRWVNGETENLEVRNVLGKFLRNAELSRKVCEKIIK